MRAGLRDEDLGADFVAGRPDALRRVYDDNQRAVFTFVRRFAPDHASDITQEVFLAAWRSRERYDVAFGSLAGWLMGIARFKVIDHLRSRYRDLSVASGDLLDIASADARGTDDPTVERTATRVLVADALAALDEPACTWIRLSFLDGLSHTEIATRADAPLGTVKSTIRRGLERIRRDLEGFDG